MRHSSTPIGPDVERPLAHRDAWSAANCSVARALDVMGSRSAMLLLREAFYGTRRFDDFARRVGISEPVAAGRLRELVGAGLLTKEPYRDPGSRSRMEYRLTKKGRDLLPAIVALMQWGDAYAADPDGPPIELHHRGCGAHVRAELRCVHGHGLEGPDIAVTTGPGAQRATHRSPGSPAKPT